MKKKVVLSTVFFLFVYYNVSMASSGRVPPSASKKTSYHSSVKIEAGKKPLLEKKTAAPAPVVLRKRVIPKKVVRKRAISKELLKKRKLIRQKRASLNNSIWDIKVVSLKGGRKTKDSVIFKDDKIAVKSLLDDGFPYTNYTLTIKDDRSIVCETMQTSKSGKVVFIRAEVAPDITNVHGIISFPKGNTSQDYSFRSVAKQVISK